LHHRAAHDQA